VNRISAIMNVPDNPIRSLWTPNFSSIDSMESRRKNRPWTEYEDQRLLCGINRFGLENWTIVSQFVGNQRTRAQCAQRWIRGLDPRISRVLWTPEEEQRLLELVTQHGEHSWKLIANTLGNRSDAQCRYHYLQMKKVEGFPESLNGTSPSDLPQSDQAIAEQSDPVKLWQTDSNGFRRRKLVLPPIERLIRVCEWEEWTKQKENFVNIENSFLFIFSPGKKFNRSVCGSNANLDWIGKLVEIIEPSK
jgi:hypothetical protein